MVHRRVLLSLFVVAAPGAAVGFVARVHAPFIGFARLSNSAVACASGDGMLFRTGKPKDAGLISATMLRMKMNPLGINHERFLVATDSGGATLGFGQIRNLGDRGDLFELASLYVQEDERGRGVGTELVRRLLTAHEAAGRSLGALFLLTLEPTTPFYEALGFRVADANEVPKEMALEVAAGTALSFVLGNKLVCMRHA